jgi:hypothetical protein
MGNCCSGPPAAAAKNDVRRSKGERVAIWKATGVISLRQASLTVRLLLRNAVQWRCLSKGFFGLLPLSLAPRVLQACMFPARQQRTRWRTVEAHRPSHPRRSFPLKLPRCPARECSTPPTMPSPACRRSCPAPSTAWCSPTTASPAWPSCSSSQTSRCGWAGSQAGGQAVLQAVQGGEPAW